MEQKALLKLKSEVEEEVRLLSNSSATKLEISSKKPRIKNALKDTIE